MPSVIGESTKKWIADHDLGKKKINFTIVSIGQSQAHAYYLAHLLNSYSDHFA